MTPTEQTTQSLCPICLERIEARRTIREDRVFLEKTCPHHGSFSVRIWDGTPAFLTWQRPKIPTHPDRPGHAVEKGCPFDCGLCPDHRQRSCTIILEITERTAIVMPDLVRVFMSEMQSYGISFALDDFGAGYTSFRYFRDFFFDIMKIDGQFIRDIHANTDNQVLTQAMISIARPNSVVRPRPPRPATSRSGSIACIRTSTGSSPERSPLMSAMCSAPWVSSV